MEPIEPVAAVAVVEAAGYDGTVAAEDRSARRAFFPAWITRKPIFL